MAKNSKIIFLAGLSGLSLALAYPGFGQPVGWLNLSFLVWIGFIFLFHAFQLLSKESAGGWDFLRTGFIAGLVYFAIVFLWLWNFFPLDTVGINSKILSIAIIFFLYLISCLGMAIFWGLWGYFLKFTPKNNFEYLFIPSVFVITEFLRSIGFGLLWYGSGTLLGPHWTSGNLTYALSNNNLILKLSSFTGIYGIDFLVIFVNLLILKLVVKDSLKSYQRFILVTVVIAVLTLTPMKIHFNQDTNSGKIVKYAIIQTNQPTKFNYSSKEKLEYFKEQLGFLNKVGKSYPQSELIIFPESSEFFKNLSSFLNTNQVQSYFGNLFADSRLIMSGARVLDSSGKAYSRVFSLDTKKDIIAYYDKQFLAPAGEFLPSIIKFILNLTMKSGVDQFGRFRELSIGQSPTRITSFGGGFVVAPLICSEILSPVIGRSAAKDADIIVGMSSTGVFHGGDRMIKELLAMARFRAAENKKPLILAANVGLSYAISYNGDVKLIAQNQESQILTGDMMLSSGRSWYNRLGDWPVLLVSGSIIGIFLIIKKHAPEYVTKT